MSDNVRALRGNLSHKRPKRRPKAISAAPGMPTWLGAEARAEWRRIMPELERLGIVARIDRATVTLYCDAWSRWVEARRLLEADGLVVTGRLGGDVKHPAWQIYRDASTELGRLAKELGTSPNARLRMSLPDDPQVDDESDLD